MRRLMVLPASMLLIGALATPVSAAHLEGGFHPAFATVDNYFHCTGETKLYQANWMAQLGSESSYTPWDETAPAESVEDGAGCAAADWGGTTNPFYDAVFQGTITGNVEAVTVRLHHMLLGNLRQGDAASLRVWALVDGVPIFPEGTTPACCAVVEVIPEAANDGVTEVYEFSITGLGWVEELLDENGDVVGLEGHGLAVEDGVGAAARTLTVYVGHHGTGLEAPTGYQAGLWVWDTTEVPSGITVNPVELAAAQVVADVSWL